MSRAPFVEIILIHNTPACSACRKTEQVIRDILPCYPGKIRFKTISSDAPEARAFGAVVTPMVVINGNVVSACMIPTPEGLRKLIDGELS